MKRTKLALLYLIIAGFGAYAPAATQSPLESQKENCAELLSSTTDTSTHTSTEVENEIELQKNITAAISDLVRAREELEAAKILNSLPAATIAALKIELNKKETELRQNIGAEALEKRLHEITLTVNREHDQNATITNQNENARRQEEEHHLVNLLDGQLANFHRIEPGSFMMGEAPYPGDPDHRVLTKITKPFGMMATPVTQVIYSQIANLANQKFPKKFQINSDPSTFKGALHPVETVSWEDIKIWIKALNQLSKVGEPLLKDLFPYWAPGKKYRLPTEAEWEFVARARGAWAGQYPDGVSAENLSDFAKFDSTDGTENVSARRPLIFEGKKFYSMMGNAWESVADHRDLDTPLPGGKDPLVKEGFLLAIRGGGWASDLGRMHTARRAVFSSPDEGNDETTFRLVEEIERPKRNK